MSGIIKLLHNGEVTKFSIYPSPAVRDKIISDWKKLYGKGYAKLQEVDEPDEDQRMYNTSCKQPARFKKGSVPKTYPSPAKKAAVYRMSYNKTYNNG